MNRYTQIVLWVVLAPVLGLVQGVTSILIYEQIHALRYVDTWQTFAMISVFYGACWFVPSVVLADLIFIRRVLPVPELKRYVGVCLACAFFIGMVSSGYLIVIGYPITAFTILAIAYARRKRPTKKAEGAETIGQSTRGI